jgi:hypothetical protein
MGTLKRAGNRRIRCAARRYSIRSDQRRGNFGLKAAHYYVSLAVFLGQAPKLHGQTSSSFTFLQAGYS